MRALPPVLCALLVSVALAGEAATAPPPPRFTKGPVASKDGGETKIAFELSHATDVAVYVLDKDGKVVRHLVAGVLGERTPKPLKAGSLEQSVTWDGKDDAGKKAVGGPFKVRVAAGLGVKFAGAAFGSEDRPNDLTNVVGLATSPDGKVYVMSIRWGGGHWTQTAIHVYNRDGSYERTIKPFPADIAAEKVKAVTPLTYADGKPLPVVHRVLAMSYYPKEDIRCQMAVTPDGNLHFLVSRAAYRKLAAKFLASITAEGGIPFKKLAGPKLPSETWAGSPFLVSSTDGKTLFATGVERGSAAKGSRYRPNRPCVYKISMLDRKSAGLLFGNAKRVGADEKHLNDPKGVAVDGKGRLFVADRGNDRVVIIDEQSGKFLGSFDVPAPTWVGAHRKTGAVYVSSKGEVIKFELGKDLKAAETGRVRLQPVTAAPKYRSKAGRVLALDDSRDEAVLWSGMTYGGIALMRCTESGGKFSDLEQAKYRPARKYWNLFPGLDRRTVGCKIGRGVRILDEESGKTRDLRLSGSGGQTYRMGPNGQIYGMDHWKYGIRRWDKNGKFMPFEDSRNDKAFKGRLWNVPNGTTGWERDFDVDRHGNVYVVHTGTVYHGRKSVEKYDRSGKHLGTSIWVVSDGCMGPRLDNRGNIYIADAVRPGGKQVPDFFKGQLPEGRIDKRGSALQQYRWMYGSVMKFGPEGGAVLFPIIDPKRDVYRFDGEEIPAKFKRAKVDTGQGDRVAVKPGELAGAKWMHYGVSYVLDMHPGHNRRCHCTATEFEVDDFGRSYYTDQGRFRVVILDTAGNEILSFGRYGNQDATGKIAFSWFTGLGFSDNYVYVADGSNRRVLRIKKVYAADRTVEVK